MTPIYMSKVGSAGFKISGVAPVPVPQLGRHIDRALWLVSKLEMPSGYGCIQNCHDRAVMSAGILHHVVVMPASGDQGSLWALVERIQAVAPELRLFSKIDGMNWKLVDGKVCWKAGGEEVPGAALRREITASESGMVPSKRSPAHELALSWFMAFHEAFADARTYSIQQRFAAEWLLKGNAEDEAEAYRRLSLSPLTGEQAAHRTGASIGMNTDFTMSVYHAFSTNSPVMARKVLRDALNDIHQYEGSALGKRIVHSLGLTPYKNWRDRTDGTSRYDRTRDAAIASKMWPITLIEDYMPKDL